MLKPTFANPPRRPVAVAAGEISAMPAQGRIGSADSQSLWVPALVFLVLLAALYYKIALHLAMDWYRLPDQSHGLLIPFFVSFLLWNGRELIRETRVAPAWSGLWLLCLGLLTLLVGVFGADLFLSRFSFILLAAGLIWTLLGFEMLKRLRFALFVAFLSIPLPAIVLNQITFPMQLYASRVASGLLAASGVPVLRDGNVIRLPSMELEVAEACSGIRSLMSLLTIAVIYGYLVERSTARRVLLALASIPIAIAANATRIFGTGLCVQYWDPDKALGFFHEFSGWLMFLISLAFLYFVQKAMALIAARRGAIA